MRKKGAVFEQKAKAFLIEQGLTFKAANVTFKGGELDLVMLDSTTIVFVEVRHRGLSSFVTAVESVSKAKIQKWQKAASLYLLGLGLSLDTTDCRFDLVTFDGDEPPCWFPNFLG
ncbi:MAG: YraN family protein [Pasteurellales bacterium]|nr:MAG: YraN family protein [Pasteurellales bacterium]